MLFENTQSAVMPNTVSVGATDRLVRLADHVKEDITEDGQVMYTYDEVVFTLPEDRDDTIEEITAHFDDWWTYGLSDQDEPVTLEARVADLENIILELLGGGEI